MSGVPPAHGAIDDEPPTFTEKTVVAGDEEVPKGGGEPTVHFANFEEIPAGSVFAEDDVYIHRVEEEGVVPILASEEGYEEIFGIYGRVTGTLEPPESVRAADDSEGEVSETKTE